MLLIVTEVNIQEKRYWCPSLARLDIVKARRNDLGVTISEVGYGGIIFYQQGMIAHLKRKLYSEDVWW